MKAYEVLMGMFIGSDQRGPNFLYAEKTSSVLAVRCYVERVGAKFLTLDDAQEIAEKMKQYYPDSDFRIREVEV